MKSSEAKALTPGTVLAHGYTRVTVESVAVKPLMVHCKTDVGLVKSIRPVELTFPSPNVLSHWAHQDALSAKEAVWAAERARIEAALGAPCTVTHGGMIIEPKIYTVALTRKQALALTARLEAATAMRAAIRAEFEAEAIPIGPHEAFPEALAAATNALMAAVTAWDKATGE